MTVRFRGNASIIVCLLTRPPLERERHTRTRAHTHLMFNSENRLRTDARPAGLLGVKEKAFSSLDGDWQGWLSVSVNTKCYTSLV